jgi:hypothetical protein
MIVERPSESNHWYTKDGSPAYSVKGKDGQPRSTTLRDARKLGLLPSVTTIMKAAASPGLEAWKLNQMMLAALTLPRADGESEESFVKRIQADSKDQARKAAERGTQVHTAIEQFFDGQINANDLPYLEPVYKAVNDTFGNLVWAVEKSFATDTFAGKIDLHSMDGDGVVVDFKTKEFTSDTLEKVAKYSEHGMQLAAYRVGLGLPRARCANIFVSVTEPGLIVVNEWTQEELARHWRMFAALFEYWKAKNSYEPHDALRVAD